MRTHSGPTFAVRRSGCLGSALTRRMNVFRRKGLKIATIAMAARPIGISMLALVRSAQPEVGHLFNFPVQHAARFAPGADGHSRLRAMDGDGPGGKEISGSQTRSLRI